MRMVRHGLGLGLVMLGWVFAVATSHLVKFGAWLMDEEKYSEELIRFLHDREERDPAPGKSELK